MTFLFEPKNTFHGVIKGIIVGLLFNVFMRIFFPDNMKECNKKKFFGL
ncbi:MAG: hypothetical protein KA886_10620 [Candidatus Cloacimonetes bacterium]|nr:hypothetical protein [Candidatus Cloacimonadota bacterium]